MKEVFHHSSSVTDSPSPNIQFVSSSLLIILQNKHANQPTSSILCASTWLQLKYSAPTYSRNQIFRSVSDMLPCTTSQKLTSHQVKEASIETRSSRGKSSAQEKLSMSANDRLPCTSPFKPQPIQPTNQASNSLKTIMGQEPPANRTSPVSISFNFLRRTSPHLDGLGSNCLRRSYMMGAKSATYLPTYLRTTIALTTHMVVAWVVIITNPNRQFVYMVWCCITRWTHDLAGWWLPTDASWMSALVEMERILVMKLNRRNRERSWHCCCYRRPGG